ncbi:DUF1648 domain-containing protein [Georgenia wangjunii]|uniref:DUF1648 domain-containing protein n=1 Tax=Georgenia wangjunii TaxID=3117730 RepID=UPI002F267C54
MSTTPSADARGRSGRPSDGGDGASGRLPDGAAPFRSAPLIDVPALTLGVGVPLLAGAAVVVAGTVWADDLGERIATHWGPSGEADSFGSRRGFVALMAAVVVVVPGVIGLFAGLGRLWSALRASLLGFGVGTALFLAATGVLSLAVQRGGTARAVEW